ncbi:30S ribosomal protein S6 [Thermoflexus sp.]|uniref:30S ribosomal protein S6 n=1 Tax=Thermoflexus sp. TaxID=1969742 RepID=UPI0025E2D29E|nr:30S ribosomal protein S6 [Thermoflexus sp.]MDW8181166.1 30S ribosomal protein S6 [Anaerolineae bacterium]MCS6964531.1 30S ribosomal protein S6 [Thermoflexus sp.]MCS7351708.1 30S ribosomal protein S6 [Thermoflexus sp.]MCX7691377.1 30S ribosomal protein S6 [Thermoflexus sp.]MDW8185714.1 30S ribosomal protein S6 [Anaerolineae bacterium]
MLVQSVPRIRPYELMVVLDPELTPEQQSQIIERIKTVIASSGGQIQEVIPWGRRRFCYPIRRKMEGQYVLVRAEMPAQAIAPLERVLRITEEVLRHLLVRLDED